MTCIIGLVDDGQVWMAGDSYVGTMWNAHRMSVKGPRKVVKINGVLFGLSGQSRVMDAFVYGCTVPRPDCDPFAWVVVSLLPVLHEAAVMAYTDKKVGKDNESFLDFYMLVGLQGRLIEIHPGLSPIENDLGISVIGWGGQVALGVLLALPDRSPRSRLTTAFELSASVNHCVWPPYHILSEDSPDTHRA